MFVTQPEAAHDGIATGDHLGDEDGVKHVASSDRHSSWRLIVRALAHDSRQIVTVRRREPHKMGTAVSRRGSRVFARGHRGGDLRDSHAETIPKRA
jgi:hypothetical protein